MKPILSTRLVAGLACGVIAVFGADAKTGAPHTFVAQPSFTDVNLSWCPPSSVKELRWHDNRDYNGDAAPTIDTQKTVKTWVGSKFSATDLIYQVGEKIEAISYFQYRPVFNTTVYVYVDGKPVISASGDRSKFEKNTWQTVSLSEAVEIEAGKEYMFVVCHETGQDMDFVAIKDSSTDASGKGDLMSTNGIDWVATGEGDYLITAVLANDVDEDPTGYNVYRGDTKLNDELITDTSVSLEDQPAGASSYSVAAVYADGEVRSYAVDLNLVTYASLLPSATVLSTSVDMLDVNLTWSQPLLGGGELSWSDKSAGISIGGSASSNTKVWVRNQFDAADLIAFRGGKISAINYRFTEAVISGVTMFVVKDGVIDYFEEAPAEAISAIAANEWSKFTLSTPYQLEDGHDYAYGLYVLHTPKTHPMGVDGGVTINVKGNSFSVSSPSSKGFDQTNPTWKTLRSGGMEGNWLMTADIEGAPAQIAAPKYDVYRDGTLIGTTDACSIDDTVDDLGKYSYSIVSRNGDQTSLPAQVDVNVKLPASYSAPLLENSSFDQSTKELAVSWNMDKEISHCGSAYAKAGFDEEMTMMWGTQFTAAELADYKGYSITKLKFMIGEEVGDLKLGVYTTKGVALSEMEIPANTLTPQAVYTIKLPEPVAVSGEETLVLAYSATVPAGAGAVILDAGPLVTGGAKISLTNGLNWLNLSTLNPAYGNYNIFISAMASETVGDSGSQVPAQCVEIGGAQALTSRVASADKNYGVDAVGESAPAKASSNASSPKVDHFNVYCNGEKIAETKDYEYVETVKRFASFDYYVTTVYTNGWESPASDVVSFTNRIAQKAVAPFGLKGTKAGSDLQLEWQSPENSTVITYVPDDVKMMALKMTGSGTTWTSYCAAMFTEEDMAANVGDYISHIQFGAGSTEIKSAAVIVMFGENIVYTQTVPLSSIVAGINDVRLNEPVEIAEGTDVRVGFIMSYASSAAHPLGCFECEDHDGLGDLVSSSGSAGYWRTLHTNMKVNYCWYVKGILSKADQSVPAKAAARAGSRSGVSYNVYRDGVLIDNVSDTSCTVSNAAEGRYYVTAVDGDKESGESNAVEYGETTGIGDAIADGCEAVIYDRASSMLILGAEASIEVYSMSGVLVASGEGRSMSLSDLASGVYTVRANFNGSVSVVKIVK